MEVILEGLGKRYIKEWIFRNLNSSFKTGFPTAIIGPNGSGKSTLLKLISGWTIPTEGSILYVHKGERNSGENIYASIDFVAPYTEVIEELSLREFLVFHTEFKPLTELSIDQFIEKLEFSGDRDKYIKHFSSGMKQRLKLGLGFYSNSEILLLDEPVSNLDENTKRWYFTEVNKVLDKKMVIIASNQPEEYTFARNYLDVNDYKLNTK